MQLGVRAVLMAHSCCFFLFDFRRFKKYFKNYLKKFAKSKKALYICIKLKNKQNEKSNDN